MAHLNRFHAFSLPERTRLLSGWGVGSASLGRREDGVGGGAGEGPSVFVDEGVVVSADEDEVVEVGGSVFGSGEEVVGVGP